MSLRMVMACAGALVCAAIGCAPNSFLSPFGRAPGQQRVVNIPLGSAAAMLETGLDDTGIHIFPKRIGDTEIRLFGKTKADKVFCIYLTRDKESSGDKTLVNLCWDRGGDDVLWGTVIGILNTPAPRADNPPASGDDEPY